MKICIISDTHNKHKQLMLPDADMIIHCGDISSVGAEHEIRNFLEWFSNVGPYKYRIFIAGNHDWLFDKNGYLARSLVPSNVIYLEDNGVEIEGLYLYGTPVQKIFCNWAFNRTPETLEKHWKAIPDNTDILITHTPPYMILDQISYTGNNEGCPMLRDEVLNRVNPIISAFGHLHDGHGTIKIDDTTFINASVLDDFNYLKYEPIVLEI